MNSLFSKKYLEKANDSFTTRLRLYLFSNAIKRDWHAVSLEDFRAFEIDKELVNLYTTQYWQFEADYLLLDGLTNEAIYTEIALREKEFKPAIEEFRKDYIENVFPSKFSIGDFESLLATKECAYCKITIDEILKLADAKQIHKKNYRGWTLEIDRKDSNFEYTPENCVMACYWCNNAKTDEYTFEEFQVIGKAIRLIWEQRLT